MGAAFIPDHITDLADVDTPVQDYYPKYVDGRLTWVAGIDSTAVPVPEIPFVVGEYFLRETRMRRRKLKLGESTQLIVATVGDSYTYNNSRWTQRVYNTLCDDLGQGAKGWCGFGKSSSSYIQGNIQDITQTDTVDYTGSWNFHLKASTFSPDICDAYSSSVGAQINVVGEANVGSVILHYLGGSATCRYRWDGGSWTNLSLSGSGHQTASLTGFPSTAWGLDIEVVSGTCTLGGIDIQSTADGIVWHKIAATGSTAERYATVIGATNWEAGLTALNPHLVMIMLGTNDRTAGTTPTTYNGYMQTIIDRVQAAASDADIFLIAVPENGISATYPTSDYTSEQYDLSVAEQCAFLDLQYVFGSSYSEYGYGSTRNWFASDDLHPDPATGGTAMVDGILRVIEN